MTRGPQRGAGNDGATILSDHPVECVLDLRQTLGESPVWSGRTQALHWVDLRAPGVHRFDPVSKRHDQWALPELAGGVVLASDGALLLALQTGIFRFDPRSGVARALVAPEPTTSGHRHNDTKVDRRGRLWTSTMRDFGVAATGALYRIDPGLAVTRMLDGLRVPNALAWSPDDRIMYFADTSDGRLRAYAFDRDRGSLGAMRILVENGVLPGRPDGAAVDADGCVWSARYGGGCVARVTPAGAVDRIVPFPVSQVTACAFGDADLRTLYVTTARQRLTPAQLAAEPAAGGLFALRVDVAGLAEPECSI